VNAYLHMCFTNNFNTGWEGQNGTPVTNLHTQANGTTINTHQEQVAIIVDILNLLLRNVGENREADDRW
jgi:hypothetical protein